MLPVGPTVATIAVFAVLILVFSAATGPVAVSPVDAAKIVIGHLVPGMPWMADGTLTPLQDQAVWQFRVPRSLLAALSGAGLALAGAMMQAVVRNPLAEPYILGVSSGASVGAVLVIVSGGATFLGLTMSGAAFVGAMVACILVAMLARIRGELSPTRMILAGVALGALLSAVTSYLTLTTDAQNVVSVMFFLLGSVSAADMSSLVIPAVALAIACIAVFGLSRSMNALLAGDESAMAVGVRTTRLRGLLLVLASLLTGAIVAVSGGIGFVGLVVPHMARLLVGSDHRRMLPITVLGGALFLMVADLLARTVAMPTEIPLGILTAFVGAPFFLWLMRSGGERAGFDR
ncbi:ABC transporter permease [Microbacterium sp. MYb54]|nr:MULTISPECIES: iron ABC transporter permease [unclassified Microbacterium]PQZ55407.1 ABC transporter permease [Microbacterium sp. MYb43]PQZ76366.1 ABC transporter permease [Microbacterium sp. MYb40]PRB26370.1 ABC transporter permease [Microbacterium sp. MYb50]PRB74487.1 ABC transporter permease [Microbacterium sp. MYb32]PRB21188.1 ABC transporter permease [Microbacterium sp. MYb54]